MALTEPRHEPPHSGSPPKRPKGILKNRSTSNANAVPEPPPPARPEPTRNMSERDIVLNNTIRNAGPNRRASSRGTYSRRQSGTALSQRGSDAGDTSPRLKWDEANLYLAEQEREAAGERMKIDEPKTPFAKQYDPAQDEMDTTNLDAGDLVVDEVERKKLGRRRDSDIPGLELGEPEMEMLDHVNTPESEKRVIVDESMKDGDDDESDHGLRHGEEAGPVTDEEKEKHKKFEQMRRKHYEMKNIKDLLGHPEQLDELDDDEDKDKDAPALPRTSNGQ